MGIVVAQMHCNAHWLHFKEPKSVKRVEVPQWNKWKKKHNVSLNSKLKSIKIIFFNLLLKRKEELILSAHITAIIMHV